MNVVIHAGKDRDDDHSNTTPQVSLNFPRKEGLLLFLCRVHPFGKESLTPDEVQRLSVTRPGSPSFPLSVHREQRDRFDICGSR